jgi:hypothetical protein
MILAARGRAIAKLIEGDPVAWGIFIAVLVICGLWSWFKNR